VVVSTLQCGGLWSERPKICKVKNILKEYGKVWWSPLTSITL
jgi:hypothetical protein